MQYTTPQITKAFPINFFASELVFHVCMTERLLVSNLLTTSFPELEAVE